MRRREPPLEAVYDALYRHFGPQAWWPGRTRLEVMVGAILTQNTSWSNVEKAIRRLRREGALSLKALYEVDEAVLAEWLRPVGYFNVKAHRLKSFVGMVMERFGGRVSRMLALDTKTLRDVLLDVKGVGPETADSILLYAADRPVFVVDAYTRRFLIRHGWLDPKATYEDIVVEFTSRLQRDTKRYNEYHALIVALGKHLCRPRARCGECPLRRWLPPGGPVG